MPRNWPALILRLHENKAANAAAAKAGVAWVREAFSADAITGALRAAVEGRARPAVQDPSPLAAAG